MPPTSIPELAEKYDIENRERLALFVFCAAQAAARWERAGIGDDSLNEVVEHLEQVESLLEDEINRAALTASNPDADLILKEIIEGPLHDLRKEAVRVHQPKKRGTKRKKLARAVVAWVEQYWTKELGRDFTSYWHKGEPASKGDAELFAKDVLMMVAPWEIKSLPRAMGEARTALRKRTKRVSTKKP